MATEPDTTDEFPRDVHIRRGQDEYWHALSAMLPQGIAWPRWPTTTIMKVVHGLAGVMGFMDSRAGDMLERESDPRITTEMLDQWERAWGLPIPCVKPGTVHLNPDGSTSLVPAQTIGERQKTLVMWMTLLGGQSREYFQSVATRLGYSITISEYRPFMCGIDRCGDNRAYHADGSLGPWPCQIGHPRMRFAWTVHIQKTKLVWFRASKGQCGLDPHLSIVEAIDLECILRTWRPAHTEVLFDYSGTGPPGNIYAGTGESLEPFCTANPSDVVCARPPYL